jgi:hypothetical protein
VLGSWLRAGELGTELEHRREFVRGSELERRRGFDDRRELERTRELDDSRELDVVGFEHLVFSAVGAVRRCARRGQG